MKSAMHYLFASPRTPFFLPLLLMRVALGMFFFTSGFNKVFISENQETMLLTMMDAGIPYPAIMAVVVAIFETMTGLMLAMGLFTRLCALILLVISTVALLTVGLNIIPQNLSFVAWYSWLMYLPETAYMLICIFLVVQGSGPFGLDQIVSAKFDEWRALRFN